jgi:RNase P subunit RPR2
MNAVAEKVAPLAGAVRPLSVLIVGKVIRVRRHEAFTYTTIICPAKDEYSRPPTVEVRSKARFAERDETTRVTCELGGWEGKSYQVSDKESGERKTLVPVNLFLDLVE